MESSTRVHPYRTFPKTMNAIRLSIPTPCHERWGEMTPVTDISSHCQSCNKVLVDFSQMSDTEVALWFSQSKGKVCGRFAKHQLNRSLALPSDKPVRANRKFWLNALWLIPMAWFSKPAAAQEVIKSKPPVSVNTGQKTVETQQEVKTIAVIKGQVKDGQTQKAVAGAKVYIRRGDKIIAEVKTDKNGNFSWTAPKNFDGEKVIVEARSGDYEPVLQSLEGTTGVINFLLYPEINEKWMGDVAYDREN
ncbi:MAG: hypothetical protein FD123_105 [Bacteroidetes bacterium]|nr:MAG: hypothetical protein FD123_105 [Bacteroidota bacterium]